jgi:prepilin-type N-terminal cleavage/methylation domain-containing protein
MLFPGKRVDRGFTLIESALATVIIGTGFVAMMQLFTTCTIQNNTAAHMTAAQMLGEHVREVTQDLPFNDPFTGRSFFGYESGETLATFDDIDDFDGQTFNPPIDSTRTPITEMSQYTQVVSVMPVYPNQPSSNTNETSPSISKSIYTGAARIRVRILYRPTAGAANQEVYRTQWVRLDR